MPLSSLPRRTVLSQQKLRQCVAGASVLPFGRQVLPALQDFDVPLVEVKWSSVRGNRYGYGGWNLDGSVCEEKELGGECFVEEQGDDCGGGGGVFDGGVARCQQWLSVVWAMWNANTVLVLTWMREQEKVDCSCPFVVDLLENWPSRAVCSFVRTGISCGGYTKTISIECYHNTTDLIMERSVTDLFGLGNDVTLSCFSAILKFRNAGCELQRIAMQKEALVDAATLQQKIRRTFISKEIAKCRIDVDRKVPPYDPKFYPAAFQEQVFDALVGSAEVYTGAFNQPEVLQHRQLCLYRGFYDTSFQPFVVLSHKGWQSIWMLRYYFSAPVDDGVCTSI